MMNKLDKDGIEKVRIDLIKVTYGAKRKKHAEAWLAKQNEESENKKYEKETSLKQESNNLAKWSLGVSILALIIAFIALCK